MAFDIVYAPNSFPKKEPFTVRMVHEGDGWLFSVTHTWKYRIVWK